MDTATQLVPAKLRQLLETLSLVTNPDERAAVLISYGEKFQDVPATIASRPFSCEHRVQFCESEAYVWAVPQPDGTLKFYFAVENPSGISAKALAVILDRTLSGEDPEEVANVPNEIVYQIFRQDIAMGKGMGLMSMVQTVRQLARHHVAGRSGD